MACSVAKKGSGVDGVCGSIAYDTDPDGECPTGRCDGKNQCKNYNGIACTSTAQCLSNYCVDGYCCGNICMGECQACSAIKKGSGSNGVCGNIAATKDPDNECNPGECNGSGACNASPQPKSANGAVCTSSAQCGSEHCVDGVCCDTACTGVCIACHLPGTVGTCSPLAAGQSDANGTPACTNVCDGNGGCVKNTGETCSGGSDCLSRICNKGICEGPTVIDSRVAWATFVDTAFLTTYGAPGINQISASYVPGGPILINGLVPKSSGLNYVLDGSFTSRGYPAFYEWSPTDGSNSPIWRRLGRGGVSAWYQNQLYGACYGGWAGRYGQVYTSTILGANDTGQLGAIVGECGSSPVDYGDGIPTFGTFLVRYKDGALQAKLSPPSNLVEPVMLGPNAEMHSLKVANNVLTLVKLNADTTPAWTKTVSGTILPGYRYDVDAQGNIILLFGFSGSVNFGAGPLTASGAYNMGFIKLDPSGNVIWQKRFDAPFSSELSRSGSGEFVAMARAAIPVMRAMRQRKDTAKTACANLLELEMTPTMNARRVLAMVVRHRGESVSILCDIRRRKGQMLG